MGCSKAWWRVAVVPRQWAAVHWQTMHALIEAHRDDIIRLCRRYGVQRLDAFGSVTRGDFDILRSDVDLVAEFAPPADGDLAAQYFDFKQHLEDLLNGPSATSDCVGRSKPRACPSSVKTRDAAVLLEDVEQHAQAASRFVSGVSLDLYRNDQMRRFAVERALEIAGEALRRLDTHHPAIAARIPQLRIIIGFRNVLAPGYAELDDARVHAAASQHAPELARRAGQLLLELKPHDPL